MIQVEWLRDSVQNVFGCIAVKRAGRKVNVGVSLRHPEDQFSPVLAKQLAIGRMIDSPISVEPIHLYDRVDSMYSAMKALAKSKDVSTSVRRAARRWISLLP